MRGDLPKERRGREEENGSPGEQRQQWLEGEQVFR